MKEGKARIDLRMGDPIGTISPNLYGLFSEHLGRCIYEGTWVGEDSEIPNQAGLRLDTLRALRRLNAPVVRWPGGCFADDYHWRDGVGPRSLRPARRNLWWSQEEPNHFGTDEFLRFCRAVGAKPYICGNVGSGSIEEMTAWAEYCNADTQSGWPALRRQNGSVEPYRVRYWAIGNENWGCGGPFSPEDYAKEYRRYATYLRRLDLGLELIACGHTTPDWNLSLCKALGDVSLMDHLSIHRYFGGGEDVAFTDEDYYNLIAVTNQLEDDIRRTDEVLSFFSAGKRQPGIIVDEWGVWCRQATTPTGLYQEETLRNALVASTSLDLFNRWAHKVTMGNLAQTINVLQCVIQTQEEKLWLTPTYHVFEMYKHHGNQTSIRCEVECESFQGTDEKGVPYLSASASISPEEKTLVFTVTNRSLDSDAEVKLSLVGSRKLASAKARCLTSKDVRDVNGPESPNRVRPRNMGAEALRLGRVTTLIVPKHSLVSLVAELT